MEKKLARFHLVTHLFFILSYFIDYLKDTIFLNLFLAYNVYEKENSHVAHVWLLWYSCSTNYGNGRR